MDVESAIQDLYALPPEDFVEARNVLAKQLQPERREDARRIRALRRPSLAAWTVNQVVRRHPDLVDRLDESGGRLHRVQQRLLSGSASGEELRDARKERDGIIGEIVRASRRMLEEQERSTGHLDEVAATFEAASVDPEVAHQVRDGRLTKPIAVQATLGPPGLRLDPAPPVRPDESRAPNEEPADDQDAQAQNVKRELEERRARLSRELDELTRQLASAEQNYRTEHAEIERMLRDVEEGEREIERLQEEVRRLDETILRRRRDTRSLSERIEHRRPRATALGEEIARLRDSLSSLEDELRGMSPPADR